MRCANWRLRLLLLRSSNAKLFYVYLFCDNQVINAKLLLLNKKSIIWTSTSVSTLTLTSWAIRTQCRLHAVGFNYFVYIDLHAVHLVAVLESTRKLTKYWRVCIWLEIENENANMEHNFCVCNCASCHLGQQPVSKVYEKLCVHLVVNKEAKAFKINITLITINSYNGLIVIFTFYYRPIFISCRPTTRDLWSKCFAILWNYIIVRFSTKKT